MTDLSEIERRVMGWRDEEPIGTVTGRFAHATPAYYEFEKGSKDATSAYLSSVLDVAIFCVKKQLTLDEQASCVLSELHWQSILDRTL